MKRAKTKNDFDNAVTLHDKILAIKQISEHLKREYPFITSIWSEISDCDLEEMRNEPLKNCKIEPCSYEPVMYFQAKVGHNTLFVKSVKVKRKEVKVEEYIIDNT